MTPKIIFKKVNPVKLVHINGFFYIPTMTFTAQENQPELSEKKKSLYETGAVDRWNLDRGFN